MTTKLYGKDLKDYEDVDIDELLDKLTAEELEQLSSEVDPDDSLLPPSERCREQTNKSPTGPLDRKHLLEYLETSAKEQEDWPECKPYQPGVKRGKVWKPKAEPKLKEEDDIKIELDLDDDYEKALSTATESELVDLAAVLGLHSMLNQDQYHASILNQKQVTGEKFETVVRSTKPKVLPFEPDNNTDVDKTLEQVTKNDPHLNSLNWNNIKNISKEKFKRLFDGLQNNTYLETLSLANTDLNDLSCEDLVECLKINKTLTSLNVESNYLTGIMICNLIAALLPNQTVLEFRASNQAVQVLGNKVEMEIAKLIEQNDSLLRLGLSLAVPDARIRVTRHLSKNNDNLRLKRIGCE
ncbi:tropomodulin-like [Centruroides sculpturatus]|uniref:tropomodulin-like n=1 Tax=Centruroides sculpturatus TaxID=218467 RepID=UPI000C6E07A3|nr:tropomodulin-like [Centruroides sculpturatus]